MLPAFFIRADGSLDMPKLMAAWQIFWREDGHLAASGFSYQEAGPHLMLMAEPAPATRIAMVDHPLKG